MRGGLNVISSKIAPATFYKVRHQIRVVRVAAIMDRKSSSGRTDVKGSKTVMAGHSPSKTGVNALLTPAIHALEPLLKRKDGDHRDKPGDDG